MQLKSVLSKCVFLILTFTGVITTAVASSDRVRVSIGQPTATSMKDAHYMLAELRDRAKGLTISRPDSLNPNEVNAYQLDVLQTLVGVNATFSEMAGVQNEFLLQDRQLFIDQQRQLLNQRSALWEQQLDAVEQLTLAQTELSQRKLDLGNDQELIEADAVATSLLTKVNQQTARKEVIDAQLAQIQSQLTSLGNVPPGTPQTIADPPGITTGQPNSAASKIDDTSMTNLIAKVINEEPNTHYSAQLNRYIEAEYELVAKHLSLLRSQISPDEDLVFLELPHSVIDVVPKKAKDYLVRTQWEIVGVELHESEREALWKKREASYFEYEDQITSSGTDNPNSGKEQDDNEYEENYTNSYRDRRPSQLSHKRETKKESNFRVLEVIPGQNALSVMDTVGKVSGLNIGAAFTWLTGFGASAAIDRQRTQFHKSVAQEVFAAGYGIGEPTFGWTFSPIPGAKRLDPGTKRTFAVAVVPRYTQSINFAAKWCAFHKKTLPPVSMDSSSSRRVNCGAKKNFTAEVINAHEKFWVSEVLFSSAEVGESISVFINGDAFPEYIRVMVNDMPLRQVISMDELSAENDQAGGSRWRGVFKRTSRESLHLVFNMETDYTGTPLISLSTPDRNTVVNFIRNIQVNKDKSTSLGRYGHYHPMFRGQLQVSDVGTRVIYDKATPPNPTHVDFIISGSGYLGTVNFYQNSDRLSPYEKWRTEGMIKYRVPAKELTEKQILLVARANRTQGGIHVIYEQVVDNPLYPVVTKSQLLTFDETTRDGLLRVNFLGDARSLDFIDLNNGRSAITHDSMPGHVLLSLNNQGDVISVGAKSKVFGEIVDYIVLNVPRKPSITAISNPSDQNKPQGITTGGYEVSISGRNLNHVGTVYFQSNQAEILQKSDALLRVRAPKAAKPGTVKVILETSVAVNGSPLNNLSDFAIADNSLFTYVKPTPAKPVTTTPTQPVAAKPDPEKP